MSAQQGDRAKNYQVAFTEPFLFDRPITAGVDLFIREIRYINQFTQASTGGNLVYGFQVSPFSRMFMNYSYENVKVKELNPLYNDDRRAATRSWPTRCCSAQGGHRTHQQDRPELRLQHGRQPDHADDRAGASRRRSTSPASAATRTSSTRASRASGTTR